MRGITTSAWLASMCLAAGSGLLAGPGSGTRTVVVRVDRSASGSIEAGMRVEVLLRGGRPGESGEEPVRLEDVRVARVRGQDSGSEEIEVDLTPEQEALVKRARAIQLALPRASAAKTDRGAIAESRPGSANTARARTATPRRAAVTRSPERSAAAGREAPARVVDAELKTAPEPGVVETFIARQSEHRVMGGLVKYLLLPGAAILALYGGIFGLRSSRTRHRGYRRNRRIPRRASAA